MRSSVILLPLSILLVSFASCKTASEFDGSLADTKTPPASAAATLEVQGDFQMINMVYGTGRQADESKIKSNSILDLQNAYGSFRIPANGGVNDKKDYNNYGTLSVNVPKDHRRGFVEMIRPNWLLGKPSFNPKTDFGLVRLEETTASGFASSLKGLVDQSTQKSVLLYIHGFNATFTRSAVDFGQIVYDIGFPGVPVLYSWASMGEGKTTAYTNDEETVAFNELPFKNFLENLRNASGNADISVICHSLGCRLLLGSLALVAQKYPSDPKNPPLINQVIFAAPDVDSGEFRQTFSQVAHLAKRWTLYANSNDNALFLSIALHYTARLIQGLPTATRAGQGDTKLIIDPGLESVDLTGLKHDFLAHGTLVQNDKAISDLRQNLVFNVPASKRSGLSVGTRYKQTYWYFEKE